MPEVVIRAGRLVDGSGGPATTVDIAIRDGAIAEIGRVRDRAHRIIDADGALVIPGLVALLPPPTVAPFDRNAQHHLAPGVTTVAEELPPSATTTEASSAYIHHLVQQSALVNRVLLAGESSVRALVMGNKIRDGLAPSNADIEAIGTLVGDAIEAGAKGIHFGQNTSHPERFGVIEALAPRWSEASDDEPIVVLLSTNADEDPEEVLHHARRILALEDAAPPLACSLIVATRAPLDDPLIGSAISPGPDTSVEDLLLALSVGRSVPGIGLNPLAVLAGHFPEAPLDLPNLIKRLADTAKLVGLRKRGRIASDWHADINIIDPAHLAPDLKTGVVSTLVDGTEIVSFNELTGEAPGQLL